MTNRIIRSSGVPGDVRLERKDKPEPVDEGQEAVAEGGHTPWYSCEDEEPADGDLTGGGEKGDIRLFNSGTPPAEGVTTHEMRQKVVAATYQTTVDEAEKLK